mgnify:CR=1 FL=1
MKCRFGLLALVVLVGCWGSGNQQPADDTPADSKDSAAQIADGEDGQADAGSDPFAGIDGEIDAPPGDGEPPPAEDRDIARLRDLSSPQPDVLASGIDYFESSYDDRGVSLFQAHIDHADAEVRRGAIYGLFTHFNPADESTLAAVQRALEDDDPVVRRVALKTMAVPQFPRQVFLDSIPRIAKHLDDEYEPDPQTRATVARMLKRYSTLSQPALPKLDDALRNDPDYLVRSAALAALYDIAQTAEEALTAPQYLLLNDPDPRLRRRAAIQLGKYKQGAAPAIDELIQALADEGVPQRSADDPLAGTDEPVCLAAADALTRIGKPAVAPLIAATESSDRRVRLLSIRALGNMGPDARSATGRLQTLAGSDDAAEATAAKAALVRIGTP